MPDCIFCKIIAGEIPCNKVYEDEHVVAFHDIQPQAPVHVLFVPKKHMVSLQAMEAGDEVLLGHMMKVVAQQAQALGVSQGYRLVSNCGASAGQSVDHLHFHLLAGRNLQWPPG